MLTLPPAGASPSVVVNDQGGAPGGGTSVYSFDVAVTSPRLAPDGTRDLTRTWYRVVVASDRLVDAHLAAAQMVGRRGMVTDVLYRE